MILVNINRLRWLIVTVGIILTIANQAHANKVLDGATIDNEISLANYLTLYVDHSKKLNLYNVITPNISAQFRPSPAQANLGFLDSAVWLKTTIINSSGNRQRYYIRHIHSTTDHIDFYSSNGDSWERMTSGDRINFKRRLYDFAQPIFPLDVDANSSKTVVIRVQNKGQTFINFGINNETSLLQKLSDLKTFSGFFIGGVFTLLIYNLFRLWNTPSIAIGYYIFYVASVALYVATETGMSFKYLWPNSSLIVNGISLFSLFSIWISCLQFSRKILSLDVIAPKIDRVTRYLIWVFLLLILTIPIVDHFTLSIIAWVGSLLYLPYLFILGSIALLSGNKSTKYYLGGMTAIIVGILVIILRNHGLIDDNITIRTVPAIAILIGLTLFSLTLSINIQEDNRHRYIDPITYLFNSVYFFERLENEFEIAFHQQHTLCLLLINIDEITGIEQSKLSFINNRLIRNIAYYTEKILRKNHIAARFNQDELAVILPNTPTESAKIIAERIRIAIEDKTLTTVSIGIACYNSKDRSNIISDHNELLEATDQAMYYAIKNGGNSIRTYLGEGEESYQGRRSTDPH
jgi:diguanylate cyclase (GGDEF)-like protein